MTTHIYVYFNGPDVVGLKKFGKKDPSMASNCAVSFSYFPILFFYFLKLLETINNKLLFCNFKIKTNLN